MNRLTPKMERALTDAFSAELQGGLERTSAGWRHPNCKGIEYHAFQSVNALFDRGLLYTYYGRRRAGVTELGRERVLQMQGANDD